MVTRPLAHARGYRKSSNGAWVVWSNAPEFAPERFAAPPQIPVEPGEYLFGEEINRHGVTTVKK